MPLPDRTTYILRKIEPRQALAGNRVGMDRSICRGFPAFCRHLVDAACLASSPKVGSKPAFVTWSQMVGSFAKSRPGEFRPAAEAELLVDVMQVHLHRA